MDSLLKITNVYGTVEVSLNFSGFLFLVAVRKENINIMFFEILSAVHVILFHSGIAQWDMRIDMFINVVLEAG